MTATSEMTPDLTNAFNRLMRFVPDEIRGDEQITETVRAYLKLGGERLARHYLQMVQHKFPRKPTFGKKRLHQDSDDDLDDVAQDEDDEDDEDDEESIS